MGQQLYYCQNFIKTGTSSPLWSDGTHYNPEDPTSSTVDIVYNTPTTEVRVLSCHDFRKMGRALGVGTAKASMVAKHAYNKIRGAYNN